MAAKVSKNPYENQKPQKARKAEEMTDAVVRRCETCRYRQGDGGCSAPDALDGGCYGTECLYDEVIDHPWWTARYEDLPPWQDDPKVLDAPVVTAAKGENITERDWHELMQYHAIDKLGAKVRECEERIADLFDLRTVDARKAEPAVPLPRPCPMCAEPMVSMGQNRHVCTRCGCKLELGNICEKT